MTAEHPVPYEVGELAAAVADQLAERETGQLAELAAAIADRPVYRQAPSDRITFATVAVPTFADRLVPAQLDRARVTLVNTGDVTVSLGSGPEVTATGSNRFDLAAGDSLTIDTRAELWAIAATAGAVVGLLVEEYDG